MYIKEKNGKKFNIKIYDLGTVDEFQYTRVVCVSKYKKKWVFAWNKKHNGWEIPGGHIEPNEDWQTAARREMNEETGAVKIKIKPICAYLISSFALLCYVEIEELGELPDLEIGKIDFFDELPDNLSYPESHTILFNKVKDAKKMNR